MFRKIVATWVSMLLVFSSLVILVNLPTVSGADLVIGDDESVYTVSGYETWEDVAVLAGGKLVVPSGATLDATNIFLQGSSIVEISGGDIILNNPSNSGDVMFNGTCSYFNVTGFAKIQMSGSDGYASGSGPYNAYIPVSMGGDAELDITATQRLRIENSTINATGGNGFDLPPSTSGSCNAWADSVNIGGYVAAGGNATMHLNLTNTLSALIIDNSTMKFLGGNGGKAADSGSVLGERARGGGYSNGGRVSGYVGSGGSSILSIIAANCSIKSVDVHLMSGNGGDAGNGGGKSGGGYAGGEQVSQRGEDVYVKDFVGKGGNSFIDINISNYLSIIGSDFNVQSGDGGEAGHGGECYTDSGHGAGGGGYGGGGGGAGSNGGMWDNRGGDSSVKGYVGTGGNITVSITGPLIEFINCSFYYHSGNGGNASDGGNATNTDGIFSAGGGGGGYGGGGASGTGGSNGCYRGGNARVESFVGSGGAIEMDYFSSGQLKLMNTSIYAKGGDGGSAGDGGSSSGTWGAGGGGGGGYGGGGAGGSYHGDGGDTILNGDIAQGGDVNIGFRLDTFICLWSNITAIGGNGNTAGYGGTAGVGAGGGGGYGGGGGSGDSSSGGPAPGGTNTLLGSIGFGGSVSLSILSQVTSISFDSDLKVIPGYKGDGFSSPGEDGTDSIGGEGAGYLTQNGTIYQLIPMSTPLLFSPRNNSFNLSETPTFTWLHLYNSTTNGDLVEYMIQIDDNPDYSSPVEIYVTTSQVYTPVPPLSDGTYYWRVKADYSTPPGSFAGWSEVRVFTIITFGPTDLNILVDYISDEIILNWTQLVSSSLDHYLIYRSDDPHNFNFLTPYNNSISWPDPLATTWIDPEIGVGANDFPYFYIVRGVNTTGFEEQNTNIVGKYVSGLDPGWNLISIPLKQSNTSIAQVFSTITGTYNIIQWYNPLDGTWLDSNGGLMDIDRFMGLWIHMKNSAKLITNGSVVNSVIHLTEGWNLVGYPSFSETSVISVFSDVPSFEAVQCYNSSDTSDHWKHHKENKPFGNDLTSMKSGLGYWVFVSWDSEWIVEY